ncbi:conserved hypothetical protein [Xenorhabdus innexi]|uniref:Membrane protein n=1 Tax=Xenorhabdus innexi TaxID=290109 RepID=A0A1N6MYU2_9GAMM|nr:membrane protein [Xenorhabdus innexi]SIP74038.1 conserved hypothetical protein [Xenorhabdus innexi]
MHWLADYWWLVLLLLAGIIISAIKELSRINTKQFLDNKPELPPHRDLNASWDDEDDWPEKESQKTGSKEAGSKEAGSKETNSKKADHQKKE